MPVCTGLRKFRVTSAYDANTKILTNAADTLTELYIEYATVNLDDLPSMRALERLTLNGVDIIGTLRNVPMLKCLTIECTSDPFGGISRESLPSVTELHLDMPGPLSMRCFSAFTSLQHLTVTIQCGYASPPLPDFEFPASLSSLTFRGKHYSTYFHISATNTAGSGAYLTSSTRSMGLVVYLYHVVFLLFSARIQKSGIFWEHELWLIDLALGQLLRFDP